MHARITSIPRTRKRIKSRKRANQQSLHNNPSFTYLPNGNNPNQGKNEGHGKTTSHTKKKSNKSVKQKGTIQEANKRVNIFFLNMKLNRYQIQQNKDKALNTSVMIFELNKQQTAPVIFQPEQKSSLECFLKKHYTGFPKV